ncbi:MAG: hypothetical protein ACT4ON_10915 [Bacteroidota bacterium]
MIIEKLKKTPLYDVWKFFNKERYDNLLISKWIADGKPLPPPHLVKFFAIKEFQKKSGHKTLIETGTFTGNMIESCKSVFKTVISIELSHDLYNKACERFKEDKNVKLYQGDSAIKLPEILKAVTEPCIFWLDGHFSSGITAMGEKYTPINEEMNSIFTHPIKNHIILIDDARLFIGEDDYPKMENFKKYVNETVPTFHFEVKDDIIRIYQ